MQTLYPALASVRAIASPMPFAPPVIKAVGFVAVCITVVFTIISPFAYRSKDVVADTPD